MPDVSITRTTQMAGPSFCIGALLLLPLSGTSGIPGELDDGLATIEEETVEEFISLLASPRMQGRDTPSIGLDLALQEVVEVTGQAKDLVSNYPLCIFNIFILHTCWRGTGNMGPRCELSVGDLKRSSG